MLVTTKRIEAVYRKVKHIKEHMQKNCLAAERAKLSIEDLRWCISDMYNLKILKIEVAFEGMYLRGMVERYKDRARILIRAGQGEEWMRFTTAKELCHLAVDELEDWSPKGHETIERLLIEEHLDQTETEKTQEPTQARQLADSKAQSEKMAEIAAIELMYPYEFRAADIKALAEQKTTLKALALHFHVPEYVIGSALHPARMHIADLGWQMANA